MCSTQDVYGTRGTLARVLGLPVDKIRVQYYEGSGTYGHSCYDDVAQAAALLSQLAGKPVRLQFMRWDEHGWDNYGPAHVGEVRAAASADGKIVGIRVRGLAASLEQRGDIGAARARQACRRMAAQPRHAGEPAVLRWDVRHSECAFGESSRGGSRIFEGRMAAVAAGSVVFVCFRTGHRSVWRSS